MNALSAIALAVLMHVTWNLPTRHGAPAAHFLWWAVGAHLVLFGAWTIPRIVPALIADPAFALAVLVTGVTNGVYFIALRHAYRHAPAGAVYPLAAARPCWWRWARPCCSGAHCRPKRGWAWP